MVKKPRPPSPPPVPEKGPKSPALSQPQSPADKTTKSSSELPGREVKVKEEKRKVQAAQGKEKEKGNAPVSSLPPLPLPNLIDHIDGTERFVQFVCVACSSINVSSTMSVRIICRKKKSFCLFCSSKNSTHSGKKKPEKKTRHLLTDLPLPPELPGSTLGSPQSPPDEKKAATLRKRPKYVITGF